MKRLLFISILLVATAAVCGCSKSALPGSSNAVAVSFGLRCDNALVGSEVSTKAELGAEEIDNFFLEIPGTSVKDRYSVLKDSSVILPSGEYTAQAYNCTVSEATVGRGRLRYSGSTQFTLSPLEKDKKVKIECTVANAQVCVSVAPDFYEYFDEAATFVMLADNPQFYTVTDQKLYRCFSVVSGKSTNDSFFEPGTEVHIKLTTKKKGASETVTYRMNAPLIGEVEPATLYKVAISGIQSASGGITFKVTGVSFLTQNNITLGEYTQAPAVVEDN